MKTAAVLLVLAGAVGCGGSSTPPAASPSSDSTAGSASGATSKQGQDQGNRLLSHEECLSLGESIRQACDTNTRSAQSEGWCSDVVAGLGTGSWVADCEKHVHYMDAVCITSNTAIRSMMDCDSAIER